LRFRKDPRLPGQAQIGDELYANNRLDRGHIARRADVCWGAPEEAALANRDSFFFTNITPQHVTFNQSGAGGIWGQLENAIFADTEVADLRISVLGGPLFRPSDLEYRGAHIPRDFWKIVYFREAAGQTLQAHAYVLTQRELDQLEVLDLPEFAVFEMPIGRIEELSGLVLTPVTSPPALQVSSPNQGVRRIRSSNEIVARGV
jgi:endonuclease G